MEKNIENMDFSGNRKKKEECFEMETKNKNKKTVIMLAVIGIAIVCICVIGVFAKKAYDRHQEELRLQAIETKNSEIDGEYQRFEKEEDRNKKLEALKQEMERAEKYKKTEGDYEECSAHYEKIIAQMKNSFVSEYDDTIKIIADKIGDDVEKVDDKEALKNATSEFTTFKDILKNDFENYNTVEQDSFDKYNSTIDDYVTKYNDRVTAIEKSEEEARKKAEEEAKKTVEAIFPYVDFLFVSEETSRRMLQRTGTLEEIMKGYADTYGCTLIATTRREAVSPTHHNFNSKIYMNGNFYEEEPYNNIEVIDRIGSGDAYLAGVLYGLIKFGTPERAIEIGNALSAVKNTVAGDMSASSIEEIESVIKSHKATGHQDEMVR